MQDHTVQQGYRVVISGSAGKFAPYGVQGTREEADRLRASILKRQKTSPFWSGREPYVEPVSDDCS